MVAIWPSSTLPVVPLMANPAAASLALMMLSPSIGAAIVMVGAVSSTVSAWVAGTAGLPAASDTFASTV
jgi:hypothetical protein